MAYKPNNNYSAYNNEHKTVQPAKTQPEKHFEKQNSQENAKDHKNDKVKFDAYVYIKSPTEINTEYLIPTMVRDAEEINSLNSKNDIISYTEKITKELELLEKMKAEGYDKLALKENHNNLKYKFELLNKRKAQIIGENEKQIRKIEVKHVEAARANRPPQNDEHAAGLEKNFKGKNEKPIQLARSTSSEESLFEYFSNFYSKCDVAIVLHCCTLTIKLSNYLEKLKRFFNTQIKIRICIIYCDQPGKYEISQFVKEAEFGSIQFKTITTNDIRNQLISLDWSKSSLKIVCNVASYLCRHQEVREIIKNDACKELMDHNKLVNYLFIDKLRTGERLESVKTYNVAVFESIFHFFNETKNFMNMISINMQYAMMMQLYQLKRIKTKPCNELIKELKSQKIIQYPIIKDHNHVSFYKLGKELKLEDINNIRWCLKISDFEKVDSNLVLDITVRNRNSSSGCKVHEACLYSLEKQDKKKLEKMWIEVFPYAETETYYTVMEIHLTAKYFSEKFNEACKKEQIIIPIPYLIKSDDVNMLGQFKHISEQQPDLVYKMDHVLIQSFMHFTYELSNGSLIVTDLRTFERDHYSLLLTEPIVFSINENKFGSSNLGQKGINYLMSNHSCNSVCKSFSRKSFERSSPLAACNLM